MTLLSAKIITFFFESLGRSSIRKDLGGLVVRPPSAIMTLLPFNVQLKIVLMVFQWCLVVLLIAMVIIWNSGGWDLWGGRTGRGAPSSAIMALQLKIITIYCSSK